MFQTYLLFFAMEPGEKLSGSDGHRDLQASTYRDMCLEHDLGRD